MNRGDRSLLEAGDMGLSNAERQQLHELRSRQAFAIMEMALSAVQSGTVRCTQGREDRTERAVSLRQWKEVQDVPRCVG